MFGRRLPIDCVDAVKHSRTNLKDSPMETQMKNKKYKVIKRVYKHSNPLFEKWLKEWKVESERKGSNMKYNYQRALNSLRKFPIPVYTAEDCKVMAHFGNAICQKIDKKLEEYIKEHGSINWDNVFSENTICYKKKHNKSRQVCTTESSENVEICGASSKLKRARASYVPAPQSGPHALLIALFNGLQSEKKDKHYMLKAELVEKAQPLCDASFLHAIDGSRYTAWSSMSTLLKKEYVIKKGNPAKYSLTDSGKTLASTLIEKTYLVTDVCELSGATSKFLQFNVEVESSNIYSMNSKNDFSPISKDDCIVIYSDDEELSSMDINADDKRVAGHVAKFTFSYIDSLGREVPLRDKAVLHAFSDCFTGFLIKCRLSALVNSEVNYRLEYARSASIGYTYAYIESSFAPEVATGLHQNYTMHSSSEGNICSAISHFPLKTIKNINPLKIDKKNSDLSNYCSTTNCEEKFENMRVEEKTVRHDVCFTLFPNQYEVILCIDNAEIVGGFSGKVKCTKKIILDELKMYQVKFNVRKLHVGDFLWILQEKNQVTGQQKELMLPYIVERKRMDDLASSIKDGRFHEQKYRLKACGIPNLIYLVEEFGSQHASLPQTTCEQAVMNTQVIDKFTVKCVNDQRDSALYLSIMTRLLQSKYQSETVYSISSLDGLHADLLYTHLIRFDEFNKSAMKNKRLTVKDMFAKHLIQLSGVSVEKAKAIVDMYPSPFMLKEAYDSSEDKENMLSSIKLECSGRKIGPVISSVIYRLYISEALQ